MCSMPVQWAESVGRSGVAARDDGGYGQSDGGLGATHGITRSMVEQYQ